jgi:MFS transporter, DHA3 family, macrolide efflux protein
MSSDITSAENKKWAFPFFTIWTGQAFSLFGSQLVQFALIWWLTRTTGSATILATASLVGLFPQVILGPLAGTLVDRWNRRITLIVADWIVALATVILAILFYLGVVQIWHVFLLLFIRSAAGSFHWPAMQASTSLMVPKQHLSRIQGLNQMLGGGMNIISAPLGALLIEFLPMQGVLAIDVSTAILATIPLLFLPVPQPMRIISDTHASKPTVWQDFKEGLRYIRGWPGLVFIMLMAAVINLVLSPAFALMPILVTRHFSGEAIQLAWMHSAWGLGLVLGGLLLSAWGGFKRRMYTMMAGLVFTGLGSLAVGFMPSSALLLAVFFVFVMGLSNPIVNGPLMAAMQSCVAPHMQGRVFTVLASVATAMTPLGLVIAGPVADYIGVQVWFLTGGVVTILLAVGGVFIPAIRNFEEGRDLNSEPAEISESSPSSLQAAPHPGD